MSKRILTVIGARPNFIKISQFSREFARYPDIFEHRLLHTGQHYDRMMKDIFFTQLNFPEINYVLQVSTGSSVLQIGEIIIKMHDVFNQWKPDLVMVVGDVNSTLAAAIAAYKSNVKIAHVESGLRSFDRSMPEELNRIITDQLADILFVTEKSGKENLLHEGKKEEQIFFVGNTMIDTLVAFENEIEESPVLQNLGIDDQKYVLVTLHRPSNVDADESLKKIADLLDFMSINYKVVFPVHPRTWKNLGRTGLDTRLKNNKEIILTDPLDYFAFQKLIKHCTFVLTDSGGIQEETTFRRKPCLTLRENTERPITIEVGTNELIPFDLSVIQQKIAAIETRTFKQGSIPPLWDGKATSRIAEVLKSIL
jgi:UDP-N-acetylglucosamine 2-epimerase (non-hydrolysing)